MNSEALEPPKIRNVAIIAHVDHGKTTLVDQLFSQSGMYRKNQAVKERIMDSMDLERERGITILSKVGSFQWNDHLIHIIDTPGHADFGGQVERVLRMADGCLLLVDAAEGPMPQTFFVLKKALALSLRIVVVINKVDKPLARPAWALNEVFDLFVRLNAPDEILDFPIIYASGREGYAGLDENIREGDLRPLMDFMIDKIPAPQGDPNGPIQMLVSSLEYSSFLGRLAVGKITSGSLRSGQAVVAMNKDKVSATATITKVYGYKGPERVVIESASIGSLVAVSGFDTAVVGQTLTDPENPIPLPPLEIDPPTLSMNFIPNDSPFAGLEGDFVTSRQIEERLQKEILSDVALRMENLTDEIGFKVSGRGELHLSILIEKMRREGYELQVSRPKVILKTENGKTLEPFEELTLDVEEATMGTVIEMMGRRKGELLDMRQDQGMARLRYKVPTRGLLGFRQEFLTATRGMGVMNYIFLEYGPHMGEIHHRHHGVLLAMDRGTTIAFSLAKLEARGILFLGPGVDVYQGQIIGENSRTDDMVVNPCKGKKLTNMRTQSADEATVLSPPRVLSLEGNLDFINDDELVEITPKNIRLRKTILDPNKRKRQGH